MGFLRVRVKVSNPQQRERASEVELPVDAGATFTVLPSALSRDLALRAEAIRRLRTADGRALEREQGLAYLEVNGNGATVPVIFGGEGDVPVLGVTTLEILGLALDPVKGELRPSEYLYLFGHAYRQASHAR